RPRAPPRSARARPPRRSASCRGRPAREASSTGPSLELLQKAEVALVVVLDVVDAVPEHGHALEAHAEGEARVLLAVDADVREDLGIDDAAAADLDPASLLADAAAAAV